MAIKLTKYRKHPGAKATQKQIDSYKDHVVAVDKENKAKLAKEALRVKGLADIKSLMSKKKGKK